MNKIRIFHVEDYQIIRDGIKVLIELESDMEVVGAAGNESELLQALSIVVADVLLLDIYLDNMLDLSTPNGYQISVKMKHLFPAMLIVIHSAYDDAENIAILLQAGVHGFGSKKSGISELVHAIRAVSKGLPYICSGSSQRLKNVNEFLIGIDKLRSKDEIFSERERQILTLLADGNSSRVIGEVLGIGERTVETHRKNMVKKCNVKNTAELISHTSALGLIRRSSGNSSSLSDNYA